MMKYMGILLGYSAYLLPCINQLIKNLFYLFFYFFLFIFLFFIFFFIFFLFFFFFFFFFFFVLNKTPRIKDIFKGCRKHNIGLCTGLQD